MPESWKEETRAVCQSLGLQKNVQFLGFQSNPIKMVHDSKVMVLTSRWEGTPMCAMEAMAVGTPVVSTPSPMVCGTLWKTVSTDTFTLRMKPWRRTF